MSVLISGVLMNPAGVPVSGAEVTFSALTNGPSVLNGFSASVITDQDGNYSIPLEICEYAISIQSDGYNSVYGSVSINEKSTPATINELLKRAAMEQAVTPAIIVYFREIQTDVAAKLATMQTLGTNAAEAASAAVVARNEAAQYAQNLSAAVAQAQQASAAATASANAATTAKNAAETAAGNAQATLADAMKKSANGADISDPAAFRANVELGSAATYDAQTSSTDATPNRILKLAANGEGSFGLGNTVERPVHSASGFFSFRMPATALAHIGLNMVGVGYQSAYLPNRRAQIFQSFADGQLRHRLSTTETAIDAATPWRVCWDDANLKKQSGSTDTTSGALLSVGAFGLGSAPPMSADANTAIDSGVTQFIRSPNAGLSNWPNNGLIAWRGINLAWDVNSASQIAMGYAPTVRMYVRTKAGTTYSGWSNVLLSNQYTIDSSGNFKTASPIITIYSDGSFTNTEEAEGVNVERISEGVYKITGCQGMHPDAAWNGIDGGISNPKCRNGQELTWNDYEVDEDGSVTVYTFHRVHPGAMPFAQNRLTLNKEQFDPKKHDINNTWPDQSPIDVPRGMYIQVRVNMPECAEPKPKVMSSNVYCNSVSPT
ncbi:prophage tail fiber N-terminal domain-containing protein [Pectobacterium sp. PL64]|uniref:phage tail fiber protein n=1 Tax=Pectobacterium sp. PL64 TaxID=2738983 RepID=UPI001F0C53FE|nr:prophage tail fiber N-terminal domain-containing protein [Pectobacterium sp. PL64]UMO89381.1 prophage tail fiber N-terminal domain-containing protein [Pectobacterium sp. PL64]